MKKLKYYSLALVLGISLYSCEGRVDEGYDNAGLTESEQAHTRQLIDSSLVDLKREIIKLDSLSANELRREVQMLREELQLLRGKK